MIAWCYTVLYNIAWCYTVLYDIAWHTGKLPLCTAFVHFGTGSQRRKLESYNNVKLVFTS